MTAITPPIIRPTPDPFEGEAALAGSCSPSGGTATGAPGARALGVAVAVPVGLAADAGGPAIVTDFDPFSGPTTHTPEPSWQPSPVKPLRTAATA